MRQMVRVGATLLIWTMFTVIIIALMTSVTGAIANVSEAAAFGIVLVIALAAAISTAAVWSGTHSDDDESMARSLAKSKRRRSRRAEDILESLGDEEIYDLEALLLAREQAPRGQRSDPRV
ncbi:MAG: hypothetical protein GX613_14640 [Chloroflexi bacterium]|nr:hypothetical protein [Chloroflexota bacterium]